MKTIVYKSDTMKVVKVETGDVCITSLKDDEDFTNLDTWNEWREFTPELELIPNN